MDRLDIDVTYGETRVMMDVTVAATCLAAVRGMIFDAIEPGCATRGDWRAKTAGRGDDRLGEQQTIAFDSASCPTLTREYLERWIKAAGRASRTTAVSVWSHPHDWRATLRSVLLAQARAETNMRRILTGAYAAWAHRRVGYCHPPSG